MTGAALFPSSRLSVPASWLAVLLLFATPTVAIFAGLAVAPLFVLFALSLMLWHRPALSWPGAKLPVGLAAAAAGWAALSCLWTVAEPAPALRSVLACLALALLGAGGLGAARRLGEPERHRLGRALVAGVALAAAVLLVEVASDYLLIRALMAWRHGGLGPDNPQALESRGAVVVLLLLWPALAVAARVWRRVALPLLLLAGAAVIGEGKYASILALAGAGGAALLVTVAGRRGRALLAAGLVAGVLAMPLIGPLLPSETALERGDLFNSARHRVVIWHFALDRWAEHPLRGWGMEASRALPGGEAESLVTVAGTVHHYQRLPLHPHNGALQAWLELGLPGALLLAAALGLVATRLGAGAASGAAALGGAVVVGCLSFGLWQGWWQSCWWLTALAFAVTVRDPRADAA